MSCDTCCVSSAPPGAKDYGWEAAIKNTPGTLAEEVRESFSQSPSGEGEFGRCLDPQARGQYAMRFLALS